MSYHHLAELPELEKLGLKVGRGPRGQYVVKSPKSKAQVVAMAEAYVKREDELPAAKRWAARDARVVVVELARNFGQQVAISAGLNE